MTPREIRDARGNRWLTCGDDCDLHVVAPATVECRGLFNIDGCPQCTVHIVGRAG